METQKKIRSWRNTEWAKMFSPRLEMQGYFLWSFKLDWKPLFQTELEVLTLLMVDKVVTAFHLTLYLFHCIMLLCISQLNLKYKIIYQFINLWPYHRSNFVFHLIERWMRESLYWSQACNHHSKFVSLVGPVLAQCCPSVAPVMARLLLTIHFELVRSEVSTASTFNNK